MAGRFRPLRADEIDCRIGRITADGLSLLLYQDARAAMDILDETVGSMNWTRHHSMINDRLYCTIAVYDTEKNAWVEKQDVGTESNTEPEKGQASDSFKRAAVNFGIGRELYSAPFIWVKAADCNIVQENGRRVCRDGFRCTNIEYDDRGNIKALTIRNEKTKKDVFTEPKREIPKDARPDLNAEPEPKPEEPRLITKTKAAALINKMIFSNVDEERVIKAINADRKKTGRTPAENVTDFYEDEHDKLIRNWGAVCKTYKKEAESA
jgi:hypothetical protein